MTAKKLPPKAKALCDSTFLSIPLFQQTSQYIQSPLDDAADFAFFDAVFFRNVIVGLVMYVMRDDKRPLCFIQSVQGFPHLLFFLLFQQAVFRRFFFRRSPIIGEIGDDIRFDDIFLDAFPITLFPVAFIFKCILKVFSANDKEIGTTA